jgi:hypothetical protein
VQSPKLRHDIGRAVDVLKPRCPFAIVRRNVMRLLAIGQLQQRPISHHLDQRS